MIELESAVPKLKVLPQPAYLQAIVLLDDDELEPDDEPPVQEVKQEVSTNDKITVFKIFFCISAPPLLI